MFPNPIMMKRLKLALRILFGLPLRGVRIDETFLLDQDEASELDYTKTAPFDLAFGGVVKDAPPEMTFEEERFRVTLFPEQDNQVKFNDRHFRWLVLELRGDEALAVLAGYLAGFGGHNGDSK